MKMENAYKISLDEEAVKLEERRVRLVLDKFGLQKFTRQVIDAEYSEGSGERRLTFRGFDVVFPGFPIRLVVTPFYRLADYSTCSQTALFRNFRHYLPYRQFDDILEATAECGDGRPVGLVYCWPGIKDGLILHTGRFPVNDFAQVLPWKGQHLAVHHFRRFVRTLAAGDWTEESLIEYVRFRADYDAAWGELIPAGFRPRAERIYRDLLRRLF
jgi:hypothetical protein